VEVQDTVTQVELKFMVLMKLQDMVPSVEQVLREFILILGVVGL
jgi:hypothetical protein